MKETMLRGTLKIPPDEILQVHQARGGGTLVYQGNHRMWLAIEIMVRTGNSEHLEQIFARTQYSDSHASFQPLVSKPMGGYPAPLNLVGPGIVAGVSNAAIQ